MFYQANKLRYIRNLIPVVGGLALLTSNLRGFLMLFIPDLSSLAVISGSFALMWTFFRTLRKPQASIKKE